MLLRWSSSQRSRSTVKFVDPLSRFSSFPVWMLSAPTSKDPTFPVNRQGSEPTCRTPSRYAG